MKSNIPQPKRIRLWFYILLLIMASGLMLMLRSYQRHPSDVLPDSSDTITVGVQYAPLSFYMYNDTLGGFDYDMFKLISRNHDIKFRFKPITTSREGLDGLESGKYDVVAADFPLTAEMRENFIFTDPVYLDRQVLVQLNDSASGNVHHITSVLDLRDDTVYIPYKSPIAMRIRHIGEELGDTIHICEISATPEQLFIKVALGEIPCAVINEQTAKALKIDYPDIDLSTSISFSQFQPWILNKNNSALCDSLDRWLADIKSTPAYQTLINRYLQ